jgi:hypothetical protein
MERFGSEHVAERIIDVYVGNRIVHSPRYT